MKRRRCLTAISCLVAIAAQAGPDADLEDVLRRALRYGDTPERRAEKAAARKELDALGAAGLRALVERLHMENIMLQVVALEFVQNQVPAAEGTPVLREGLYSPHEQTRRACAFMLGFYPKDESSTPHLLEMLDRERERNAAIRTLGIWRVGSARDRIRELLRAEQERTRIAAANALGRFADPSDAPALIEVLGDSSLLVRNAAARALLAMDPGMRPAMRRALRDANGVQLRQLVRLAGTVKDRKSLHAIKALKKQHMDPELHADMEWAMARIRGRETPQGLTFYADYWGEPLK